MLSIIIITYNREPDLLALLKNIKDQDDWMQEGDEILVLNNNSTTDYSAFEKFKADNEQLRISYYQENENLGVALARNELAKKARNPHILWLDDDIEFRDQNGLATLRSIFQKPFFVHNKTAIITLAIRYFSNNEVQINAFPKKDYEAYKDKPMFLTYYFMGGANIMKKEVFDKIGYYPEDYFYGMEEYDLGYRVLDAGYTIGYDSSVTLMHKESPEGRVPNAQKLSMLWINKSKVAFKYLPKPYFYSTVIIWGCYYLIKSNFQWKLGFASLKKIVQFAKNSKRKTVSRDTLQMLKSMDARLAY